MSSLSIGIAGATGALGAELLKALVNAPWKPETVVPLASVRTSVSFVEYDEQQIAVDSVTDQNFDELDLLFSAVPEAVSQQIAGGAIDDGVLTVDCSGVFRDDPDVPMMVPWVNPERTQEAIEAGAITLPHVGAIVLGSVLGPLFRAGLGGEIEVTLMCPASLMGRAGITELSGQVIALFNSGSPPRKVFPEGLAFDLSPCLGELQADGWTDLETRVLDDLIRIVPGLTGRITVVGVPVFSGISAQIRVSTAKSAPVDLVKQILRDGGVRLPGDEVRKIPRPRRVEGEPFVQVGRVRVNADGILHLWASADNLRATATVAVACAGLLLKSRGDDRLSE